MLNQAANVFICLFVSYVLPTNGNTICQLEIPSDLSNLSILLQEMESEWKLIESSSKTIVPFLKNEIIPSINNISNIVDKCNFIEKLYKRFSVRTIPFSFYFAHLNLIAFHYKNVSKDINDCNDDEICMMKQYINRHCMEDGYHYLWLLNDLKILNIDKKILLSKLLKYMFESPINMNMISSMFKIIRIDTELNGITNPLHRYYLMSLIEITATGVFKQFEIIGNIYNNICNNNDDKIIKYWANTHSDKEPGHILHSNNSIFNSKIIQNKSFLIKKGKELQNAINKIYLMFVQFIKYDYNKQNLWSLH